MQKQRRTLLAVSPVLCLEVSAFYVEQVLAINDEQFVIPDATLELQSNRGKTYRFFVELDTGSERVDTDQVIPSSVKKKLEFYERYRLVHGNSFRVLFVTTSSNQRADNILSFSNTMTNNRAAQMVYAAFFGDLQNQSDWIAESVFQNHRLEPVTLIP